MRQYLAELLVFLTIVAVATTVGVLILTRAGQHGLPRAGADLDFVGVGAAFVVYGMLDGLIGHLRDRFAPEADESDEAEATELRRPILDPDSPAVVYATAAEAADGPTVNRILAQARAENDAREARLAGHRTWLS